MKLTPSHHLHTAVKWRNGFAHGVVVIKVNDMCVANKVITRAQLTLEDALRDAAIEIQDARKNKSIAI